MPAAWRWGSGWSTPAAAVAADSSRRVDSTRPLVFSTKAISRKASAPNAPPPARDGDSMSAPAAITAEGLVKIYRSRRSEVHALDGIDLEMGGPCVHQASPF